MRILAVHNYYYSRNPSGENIVFDAECDLLRHHGHHVDTHVRRSDEIRAQGTWGALKGAMATPWNPFEARKLRQEAERLRPDVVHVHNTFPLISPAIFRAIGKRAARVLTLHNYRLVCPAAIPMRDGRVCTACMDNRSVVPSLWNGCYRDSRLATIPLATNVALHGWLGTWRKNVDAFIALSQFQKSRMVEAGLPERKVHVKPNFFPGMPTVVPWCEREPFVVFVGRLSHEKGVRTLIEAWKQWNWPTPAPQLKLVGDGLLREELEEAARGLPISFLGQVGPEEAQRVIAKASLLVVPSLCFEGFPMVLREAFAFGTPVAVSNLGPLPSIVKDGATGRIFQAGDHRSLAEAIQHVWGTPGRLEELGRLARREFEHHYTEEANIRTLHDIYGAAISERQSRGLG